MQFNARLIVFDVDGTLADSIGRIIEVMQVASVNCKVKQPSTSDVRNVIGMTLRKAIAALMPEYSDEKVDEVTEEYRRLYKEMEDRDPVRLYPSVISTLQTLKQQGFELAIATGKSRAGLERIYVNSGLRELITCAVSGDMVKSKPDPMMLQTILEHYGLKPEQALMVGDSNLDLRMATNAGVPSIGITWGVHPREVLEKESPVAIIGDVCELPDLVNFS
ncbi:MAG: HAD family hydrolase [Succinivibrionaceae bacterium]